MNLRTANKRQRRRQSSTPCFRATDRKWFWTWEVGEYAGCVVVPFRGYRYYGRK